MIEKYCQQCSIFTVNSVSTVLVDAALLFATVTWSSAHCGTEWRSSSLGQAAAALPAPLTSAPRLVLVTASGHAVSPLVLYWLHFTNPTNCLLAHHHHYCDNTFLTHYCVVCSCCSRISAILMRAIRDWRANCLPLFPLANAASFCSPKASSKSEGSPLQRPENVSKKQDEKNLARPSRPAVSPLSLECHLILFDAE